MNKLRLSAVNFIRKTLSKSFNNGIVYNRVVSKCICATISRHYIELFCKLFTGATESGWSKGGCNFENVSHIKVPNVTEGKFMFFEKKLSQSSDFYYLEPVLYLSITDIVEAMNLLILDRHNDSENCIKVKVSRKRKKLRFTLQMKDPVLHSLLRIWDTFWEVMLVMKLE